jgi:cysteine-rich repeat protein
MGALVALGVVVLPAVSVSAQVQSSGPSSGLTAIPGQIVVRYRDTVSLDPPAAGRVPRAATAARDSELARLNAELGVRAAHRIATPRWRSGQRAAGGARAAAIQAAFPTRAARGRSRTPLPDVDRLYVLELDPNIDVVAAATRYARDPNVLYAHPNFILHADELPLPAVAAVPNDPFVHRPATSIWREQAWEQPYPDLWSLQRIHAIEAWNRFPSPFLAGSGMTVAVVDTGLDALHPDIVGGVHTNSGEIAGNMVDDDSNGYVDDVAGWDFTTFVAPCNPFAPKPPDADPFDDHGHGTHVSGTIAARANNGIGIAGVAPGAGIMPLKGLGADGCGLTSELVAAIIYAADNGADVANMSFGGLASAAMEDALAYAHGLGVVLVTAAGNSHVDTRSPVRYLPADSVHAITVAASDEIDLPTYFSNVGEKIDVAAPGGGDPLVPPDPPGWNILSLLSSGAPPFSPNDVLYHIVIEGEYLRLGGTSMASPHVAGLAALVLAQHPTLTNEEVRQVIRSSARDIAVSGFDIETGAGRIDAAAALDVTSVLTVFLDSPGGGAARVPVTFSGTVSGPGLQQWELSIGAGLEPDTWTLLASSTTPVVDGAMLVWDPNEGLFPEGTYTVLLRATALDGRVFEARHGFVLVFNSLPGWPTSGAFLPGPVAVGDTHATPGLEVVTAGGTSIDRWTTGGEHLSPLATTGVTRWLPTLGDLDHDGRDEILIGSESGLVIVNGDTLTTVSSEPLGPMYSGAATPVVVDDLDGDGWLEIVTLDLFGHVTVRDHNGMVMPGWPQQPVPPTMPNAGVANTDVAVGDLDGDGVMEIVYGAVGWFTDPFTLVALRLDGTTLWRHDIVPPAPGPIGSFIGNNDVVLGDVDHDGDLDVVFASIDVPGNHFFVLDGSGAIVDDWIVPFDVASIGTPGIGTPMPFQGPHPILVDLDGDLDLEIAVGAGVPGSYHPLLYAWHHDGTPVLGFPSEIAADDGYSIFDYLVAGDVDGDGTPELLSAMSTAPTFDAGPRVYAWDASGHLLADWPRVFPTVNFNDPFTAPKLPMLVDLDGDGRLDLVSAVDGVEVAAANLGVPVSLKALQWPTYRHDVGRTGRYAEPTCGNGAMDPGEECDDGNGASCDGCSGVCTLDVAPVCGDGAVSSCGEECDDGNLLSGDGCDANCTRTRCGNGVVSGSEECDDGNVDSTDGCTSACTLCGNGVITAPEECDDANSDATDGCTNACSRCGNGLLSPLEECDDGNRTAFDCCAPNCTREDRGSTCVGDGDPCSIDECSPVAGCLSRPSFTAGCPERLNAPFEVGIPTAKIVLKDGNPTGKRSRLVFKSVDLTGQDRIVVPQPTSPLDPTLSGARLRVFRPGPYGDEWAANLLAQDWTNRNGAYQYKGTALGMSIKIKLTAGNLKVRAKGLMPFTLDEPAQHSLAVSLTLGQSISVTDTFELCAVAYPKMSGNPPSTARYDRPGVFIGGISPPPAACPAF